MIDFRVGDCREVLRTIDDGVIHLCVTSPPYLGLRSYGLEPTVWGGDPDCTHEWSDEMGRHRQSAPQDNSGGFTSHRKKTRDEQGYSKALMFDESAGKFCSCCGAWLGCLGLEPSIGQYVANVVEVFAEVHRVLHPEGVVFLNLGDSFARDWKKGQHKPGDPGKQAYVYEKGGGRASSTLTQKPRRGIKWEGSGEAFGLVPRTSVGCSEDGLKPKNLCMIPHRVALALQEWGWWVRDEVVWVKPNILPASVTDRTTRQHEFIFMLTKSDRYFYDEEAIREPAARVQATPVRYGSRKGAPPDQDHVGAASERALSGREYVGGGTRRPRSVWEIATQPLKEAHFAAFPEALVERCIKAGSSEGGCCPVCNRQWRRIVEKGEPDEIHQRACGADLNGGYDGENQKDYASAGAQAASDVKRRILAGLCERRTVGWEPACRCGGEPLASIVLDPFSGSGRTGLVAKRLGRDALLIDAKADYVNLAKQLCGED